MSTPAKRRLMRDFKVCVISPRLSLFSSLSMYTNFQRMQQDPPSGVSASPLPDNVMTWYVTNDEF